MLRLLPGKDRPFTGFHMLGVVLLFFGTIIGVNAFMAYAAVSTFPGLNAHNSYVASQTYNLLLSEAAEQEKRGWRADITVRDGLLRVALRDRSGDPLVGLAVTALAGRPASAATDQLLSLPAEADAYEADKPLAAGRWLLEVEARDRGRLVWRGTRSLVVAGIAGADGNGGTP